MREKIITPQNQQEKQLCNQLTEMLTRATCASDKPKRIDELDDLNSENLIEKFKEELPGVYEHNLAKCHEWRTIDNNFPSDEDIKWILRTNRVEKKDIDDFNNGGRERQKEFLESELGQAILNL